MKVNVCKVVLPLYSFSHTQILYICIFKAIVYNLGNFYTYLIQPCKGALAWDLTKYRFSIELLFYASPVLILLVLNATRINLDKGLTF